MIIWMSFRVFLIRWCPSYWIFFWSLEWESSWAIYDIFLFFICIKFVSGCERGQTLGTFLTCLSFLGLRRGSQGGGYWIRKWNIVLNRIPQRYLRANFLDGRVQVSWNVGEVHAWNGLCDGSRWQGLRRRQVGSHLVGCLLVLWVRWGRVWSSCWKRHGR